MNTGWGEMLRGGNAARCAVVGGGMVIHAINSFVVVTVLPSIVREIGGLEFFAWNATLYVVASLLSGAACARLLARFRPRLMYRLALLTFAAGCALCALAPSMPVLLAGRFCQGLGAGTLSALSFTMVRVLFAEHLWPRALAITSGAWGVATLIGPALGGFFAQYTGWRAGFWSLFCLAPVLIVLVESALPRNLARIVAPRTPFALTNLLLLAAAVLCVSAGSMASDARLAMLAMLAAVAGLAVFVRREAGSGAHLLPRGACNPRTPLGGAYATMALLLLGITTEIFVPFFLQVLHGMTPLHSGYLSALMAGGWTTGALLSSGATARRRHAALLVGPVALGCGLIGLWILMPVPGEAGVATLVMGCALASMGLGIGMCWPHLAALVFTVAHEDERALAASSITVVIMVSNAFGAAIAGLVTNLAGLTRLGLVAGAASASSWLFGCYVLAPVLAFVVLRRLRGVRQPVAA
jgi:MFS family permease